MKNIVCPNCKNRAVKNGFQGSKQRYKCTVCNKKFQLNYTYSAYKVNINNFIIKLLKEGCGIRGISRVLNISKNTVLSRILKISKFIKSPGFNQLGCKFEVDELWTYIGAKSKCTWITYALERGTRKVIDFFVGSKSKDNIRPLINRILLLSPERIYTDKLNIYPSLIPKDIHRVFRYCTNRIERKNLTLRTHIKRISRKTICYSKKKEYLEAHLRIYFWG